MSRAGNLVSDRADMQSGWTHVVHSVGHDLSGANAVPDARPDAVHARAHLRSGWTHVMHSVGHHLP